MKLINNNKKIKCAWLWKVWNRKRETHFLKTVKYEKKIYSNLPNDGSSSSSDILVVCELSVESVSFSESSSLLVWSDSDMDSKNFIDSSIINKKI